MLIEKRRFSIEIVVKIGSTYLMVDLGGVKAAFEPSHEVSPSAASADSLSHGAGETMIAVRCMELSACSMNALYPSAVFQGVL